MELVFFLISIFLECHTYCDLEGYFYVTESLRCPFGSYGSLYCIILREKQVFETIWDFSVFKCVSKF